jgi:hypothetical protein
MHRQASLRRSFGAFGARIRAFVACRLRLPSGRPTIHSKREHGLREMVNPASRHTASKLQQ